MKKQKYIVAVVRYQKPYGSVKQAVSLSNGLAHLRPGSKVFIKPNIVFWTKTGAYPKWGVITTSRVVQDMVRLLSEHGITDITVGEGTVVLPQDRDTPAHAFASLGYPALKKRYGLRYINIMERPFEKVDLGGGVVLKFNRDILESDFVVNLPVMKTHSQTIVSLGIKNIKGTIDTASRKKCHNPDPAMDLHYHVARLADKMPPMFTLVDGIYTCERGPGIDGRMHRSDLLAASSDVFGVDKVGASLLGYEPKQVPYLVNAAANHKRPLDLSDIEVVGEKIEDFAVPHTAEFEFSQATDGSWMPAPLIKMGMSGLSYRPYDATICTYCSTITSKIMVAIAKVWDKKPWDKIEVLTGKYMQPSAGMKKTILLGKCIYQANKNDPKIQEMIEVKGCPPQAEDIVKAFQTAGVNLDPAPILDPDFMPRFFMANYRNRPEFDDSFYVIEDDAAMVANNRETV